MSRLRLGEAKPLTPNHEAGKWLSLSSCTAIYGSVSFPKNWVGLSRTMKYMGVDKEE